MLGIRIQIAAGLVVLLAACGQPESDSAPADDAMAPEATEEAATEESASEDAAAGHTPENVAAFEKQCLEATEHEGNCACAIEAIHELLPAEHVQTNEDGTVTIHDETPEDVNEAVTAAIAACEEEHLPAPEESETPEPEMEEEGADQTEEGA